MSTQALQAYIASFLGNAPAKIEPGRWHRFSTNNKPSDTAGYCKMFEDERGGVFGDFRAGISKRWSLLEKYKMTPMERAAYARQVALAAREREEQQRATFQANASRMQALQARLASIQAGDPVALYLAGRGLLGAWNLMPSLRIHRALPYMHDGRQIGTYPAMIAPIVAPDGRTVALHRTYLTEDGQKAAVPTVRKVTPACGSLKGAAIRPFLSHGDVLGVAEGIETALAASLVSNTPVWSTYSAGGLAAFCWPAGIRKLLIFGDADPVGRASTEELRLRADKAGLVVSVLIPRLDGMDWLDVYAAAKETK